MRRRRTVALPADLLTDIEDALVSLDAARHELAAVRHAGAPLPARRRAHATVAAAFEDADRLLRTAAALTRPGPYLAWSQWRRRLSRLDLARQVHLFEQADDVACLGLGTVQAVDTGMSGPSIGDLQHGESRPAGAPASYGLDIGGLLGTSPAVVPPATHTPPPEPAQTAPDGGLPDGGLPDAA